MARPQKKTKTDLPKVENIKIDKISCFFRRSILKQICKILLMEHSGFRSFKSVKNINRLFTNINMSKYKGNVELESYIWVICYVSKQWLDGIATPDIIAELAKSRPEYNNIIEEIITNSMNDPNIVTAPEAKAIFDLIAEALQFGYVASLKDEYIKLFDDIDMNEAGAYKKIVERLFMISQSLMDIKHNTNMVANKIQFNTADPDSMKEAISNTLDSLSANNCILKTGIRRLNTLLSPGYMNGRMYTFAGAPGSFKSGILLKSALDIRKYNPGFQTRTPGMKPCCLYISMENTFNETIERIWNMCFDDPMVNYSEEEVYEKLADELGINKITNDDTQVNNEDSLLAQLKERDDAKNDLNIEIVLQYYPYRSINTDDLFTIIADLREENLEVCALVFDYIKRIEPANPIQDNERLELDRICNELKALAVMQNIPVITAHQLNRTGAAAIDSASRSGKHDVIKEAGRENIGGAWSVVEVSDFLALVGTEYKPGTDERYLTINVVKRRRIDASENEFAKFTYLAHPFSKNNPMRLLDDMNTDKVLSLQSLGSDIDILGKNMDKTNAVPRLQTMKHVDFDENY